MSNAEKMVMVPPYIGLEPLVGLYYPAQCRDCGWVGSSEELTEDDAQCTRDIGDRLCLGDCDELGRDDLLRIIQAMAKAQRHQGEPVVLPARKDPNQQWHVVGGVAKAEGWNAYHDEIAKLGPLYTHPVKGEPVAWTWQGSLDTLRGYCPAGVAVFPHKSPGTLIPLYTHVDHAEVERIRAELAEMTTFRDNAANHMRRIRAEATAFEKERDTLRANLSKAHELLGEALRSVHADAEKSESSVAVDELEELAGRIEAALSSSAEPSAPVEREPLVSEDELRDLAASACQSALAHGISEDWFMRLASTVEQRARAALERKP